MSSKSRVSAEMVDELKDVILTIVKGIVDHPEEVTVNVRFGELRLLAELHTDPADVGSVIGRRGHIVGSIRSIISAFAGKNRVNVDFDYVTEEDNSKRDNAGREKGGNRRRDTG